MRFFAAFNGAEEFLLGDRPFVSVENESVDVDIRILAEDGIDFFLLVSRVQLRVSIETDHFRDHAADVALLDFGVWLEFPVVRVNATDVICPVIEREQVIERRQVFFV